MLSKAYVVEPAHGWIKENIWSGVIDRSVWPRQPIPGEPRVLLYVRVSTQEQADEETHQNQIDWGMAEAKIKGWLCAMYIEPGKSGENLEGRPIARQMLADIEAGYFDAVAAIRVCRFCRSQDLTEWGHFTTVFKQAQVSVITRSMTFNLRDPASSMMFTMFGPAIAGFFKATIMEQFKDGMTRAAKAGRKPTGITPVGLTYDRKEKKWGIEEETAETIKLALKWASDPDATLTSICEKLTAMGRIQPNGKPWDRRRLSELLHADHLTGTKHYKLFGDVPVPAIVEDEELLVHARSVIAARAPRLTGPKPIHQALCRKRIRCANCMSPMVTWGSSSGELFYRCQSTRKGANCGAPRVQIDLVDQAVWELIEQMIGDPEAGYLEESVRPQTVDPAEAWEAEARQCRSRLSTLQEKEKGLTARWKAERISDDAYDSGLRDFTQERGDVTRRLKELESAIKKQRTQRISREEVNKAVAALGERLGQASFEEKLELLSVIWPDPTEHGVLVEPDGRIVVRGALPVPVGVGSAGGAHSAGNRPADRTTVRLTGRTRRGRVRTGGARGPGMKRNRLQQAVLLAIAPGARRLASSLLCRMA